MGGRYKSLVIKPFWISCMLQNIVEYTHLSRLTHRDHTTLLKKKCSWVEEMETRRMHEPFFTVLWAPLLSVIWPCRDVCTPLPRLVFAKAPCLDDNLVRRLDSNPYFWDLITKMMLQDRERDDNSFANASACHGPVGALLKAIGVLRLWSLFTKFVWWCAAHCAKSHKDRVVLVFHELVSTCSYT